MLTGSKVCLPVYLLRHLPCLQGSKSTEVFEEGCWTVSHAGQDCPFTFTARFTRTRHSAHRPETKDKGEELYCPNRDSNPQPLNPRSDAWTTRPPLSTHALLSFTLYQYPPTMYSLQFMNHILEGLNHWLISWRLTLLQGVLTAPATGCTGPPQGSHSFDHHTALSICFCFIGHNVDFTGLCPWRGWD